MLHSSTQKRLLYTCKFTHNPHLSKTLSNQNIQEKKGKTLMPHI